MTFDATSNQPDRNSLALRVILAGLFLIGLVSSCSETPTARPDTTQRTARSPVTTEPSVAAAPSQDHLAGIGSATVVTIHGKIVSVDRAKMLVTLEGPHGKTVIVHVHDQSNLAAVKRCESFVARFYEVVTIRKKLPGESIPSASLQEGIVSAARGQAPGAVFGNRLQLVATIDAINADRSTVELKGPDGIVETVNVANPENLAQVKVGDQLVIALTNVVAIALVKESPT